MDDLQQLVARSADAAELHATVPTLLLDLATLLGSLAGTVNAATERGRRPYRPGDDWVPRLGELAYGVFLLADQTGVDLGSAVQVTATLRERSAARAKPDDEGWPFGE